MESPIQVLGPMMIESTNELSPAPSSPRRASLYLNPCSGESAPSELAKANGTTSGAVDEGPITIQGEELGVKEASEQHEAITDSEGQSSIGEEEPVPIEQPGAIVLDNRDVDVGNEGLNTSKGEGPDERSEQPVAVAPNDMDRGVGDEGPNIFERDEPSTDERPGATSPDVVIEALVLEF
ncbi:hypothetical protein AMTR_s00123p00117420 [Amborella trichopoda]|uniref:Uncharacterized protein n=1 Tax=Amborella trichopoda TaxID=13333 RepID=W1NRZ3_AMBTC|nr:hypothetical protein AMTR_s00123p00117420 [Amborella trichopoda]